MLYAYIWRIQSHDGLHGLLARTLRHRQNQKGVNTMSEREKVQVTYDATTNTAHFDAEKEKFYPGYLKYMMEYLKIPADAKLIFKGSEKCYILKEGSNSK